MAIILGMESLPTLRQCLVDTELAHLRIIARLWGLEVKAGRPLEVAAELAQLLADPAHAADTWRALPDDERAALTALLDAGGLMPTAVVVRRFGEIRAMGPGRLERETPWRDPISPAEGLWYRGLIYAGFAGQGSETYPIYFVPAELQTALPVRVKAREAIIQIEPAAPPARFHAGSDLLLEDLATVLAFVHNGIVRPRDEGSAAWPRNIKRMLLGHLRSPDPVRLDFILHVIDQQGWFWKGDDGRLRLVPEPVMTWLQEPADQSLAVLVDAWRQVTGWDELWCLTALQPDDTGTWRSDPTLARAALMRYLAALTPGEWVRVADFVSAIKVTDPDFQRPGGDYETWYVRDPATGAYVTGFESWDRVEGELLRALLQGPAWWLGLIELAADVDGESPQVFRVPAPVTPTPAAEQSPPVVRPDLTVTMPTGRRFERFQLARVADLVLVGDPYVYRLTPASLHRARRQRIDLNRVLSFLDSLSEAPLPKAVRLSLTRCYGRGTEVWLERTVLLRVTDEAVMKEIIASPKTGRFIERTVGSTSAVVAEKDWPSLVAGLVELGLLAELVGIMASGVQGKERKHDDRV
jgi:hypothetical protein